VGIVMYKRYGKTYRYAISNIARSLESYNVVIGGVMKKMEGEKGLMKSIQNTLSKRSTAN